MFDELQRQRLETLDGSRTRDKSKAAVRVEDLTPLLQLAARLKSAKAAGANPTKAEFDALVDDVHQIDARLKEIATALQAKILP